MSSQTAPASPYLPAASKTRPLLVSFGIALVGLSLIPWAHLNYELVFAWDTLAVTPLGVTTFILLLPICGVTFFVLGVAKWLSPSTRSAIILGLSACPFLLLDFVQLDLFAQHFVIAPTGFLTPLSLMILSYGFRLDPSQTQRNLPRIVIGIGGALLLIGYLVPTAGLLLDDSVPRVVGLLKAFTLAIEEEPTLLIVFVYRLFPLGLVAIAGYSTVRGGYEKPSDRRLFANFAAYYYTGSLLLTALIMLIYQARIFFPLYLALAATGYTVLILNSLGVIVPIAATVFTSAGKVFTSGAEQAPGLRDKLPGVQPATSVKRPQPAANPPTKIHSQKEESPQPHTMDTTSDNREAIVQKLIDLKKTHDAGLLTDEEYGRFRKVLLARFDGAQL